MQHIKGIIFDLDGTLVSSSLDFNAIRRDIGCPPQQFDLPSDAIMMVGDYKYDLQAGRNAGMATCLINYQQLPDYVHLADYRFEHFGLLSDAMFNASTARF